MDELLDSSYRQEISADVESFCTLYPSVPVLVTSRKVGYEQAPLDPNRFDIFLLAALSTEQVTQYVENWFKAEDDLTPVQQKQKASAFLKESEIVPDLRSNPLMLALMCNIYRGDNYIPKNRPDVYEKCALMLFERWDKSRGILVPLPFESHIRPSMMFIAHWIYSDVALQGGVTEKKLIALATKYLCPRRFENRDEAEQAAKDFIEFCRGRAWVFTEAGTTKEGERLYQFTHRTFLEYFTAAHMVRTHPTPDKLADVLIPRIASGEWDVVAQLAFQIQNKNVEGAGDELLGGLLKRSMGSKNSDALYFISFAARCLEFMIPSPKIVRDIVTALIEISLATGDEQHWERLHDQPPRTTLSLDIVFASVMYRSSEENLPTIADCFEKRLIGIIENGTDREAGVAFEMTERLAARPSSKRDMAELLTNVKNRIYQHCQYRAQKLSSKYVRICISYFWHGAATLQQIMEWGGPQSVFTFPKPFLFNYSYTPLAELFLERVVLHRYSDDLGRSSIGLLRDLGFLLPSYPPPWMRTKPIFLPTWASYREKREDDEDKLATLDRDALFGAFLVCATYLEVFPPHGELEWLKSNHVLFWSRIAIVLLARFRRIEPEKVETELDACGFSAEQRAFVQDWISRRISLSDVPPQGRVPPEDNRPQIL